MNWRGWLRRRQQPAGTDRGWRRAGFPLGLAVFFVAAFVVGFYLNFPLAPYARQLEQQVAAHSQARLQIVDPRLEFPPAVAAQLRISSPDQLFPELIVNSARISPLWSSLFSGAPGAEFVAKLLGGTATGSLRRDGRCKVELNGLTAEQLQLSPQLSLRLTAADTTGSFDGQVNQRKLPEGELALTIGTLQLHGVQALGAQRDILQAGSLRAEGTLRGPTLNLSRLELSGGELDITGSGSLLLTGRPETSRLNLNFTLKPNDALDPQLKDLLTLLVKPQSDGSLRVRLGGTLAAPQMR